MCGVIGICSSGRTSDSEERVRIGVSVLHHRGPNDFGVHTHTAANGADVILGHTRLSIIDLSPGGHQPMLSKDGRYTLVFNGEIYNYRELRRQLETEGTEFLSDSDTEVLLAAWITWGVACLGRLRGMFAFAVFDRQQNCLTCARDAFGIKPFFYVSDAQGFRFASELPALLVLQSERPTANLQQAYDYLAHGSYDNGSGTFLNGVSQLMPGHVMSVDLQSPYATNQERWWWPSIEEHHDLSFDQAAEQLREMFIDNVRLHLRSDVPLGVAVSGGIDSSAVACTMRMLEPDLPINAFCFVARGSVVDEEAWADTVIQSIDANQHKIVVSASELCRDIEDMIRAQGEPFGGTSIYAQYRVFKSAQENGITVTLDGQGADELLAGYAGYPAERLHSLLETRQFARSFSFLNRWSSTPGRGWTQGGRTLAHYLLPQFLKQQIVNRQSDHAWLNLDYLNSVGVRVYREPVQVSSEAHGRRVVEALRRNLTGLGLTALLRHSDRNAMRWSIESRVPFLTTDLAEYLLSLPEHFLISDGGETKTIFRAAMRGIVPDAILDRKDKIGFATPEQQWLSTLGPKVLNWLDGIEQIQFLHADKCIAQLKQMIDGQQAFSCQAWRLINYCLWAQTVNLKN